MTDDDMRSPHAVVVGGGLAGITAALQLAEAGTSVTLVESRTRLGGLAFSFRRGDLTVDNGQHVYLRCCTAYSWFLDRIDGALARPGPFGRAGAGVGHKRSAPRPAAPYRAARPLHLAAGLATYPHLSLAERAAVGRAALALQKLDPADPALDGIDFATWLGRHGQSARAIEALWDLVGVATLNATAPHASMGLAAMVFKTGLLSEPGAADIGWARVPLGELHDTLARKALDSAGVRTELSHPGPRRLPRRSRGAGTSTVDGELLEADTVVLAVPQREAHALLPDGALDDPDRLLDIGTAPILNVHVVYDRKVLRRPFFAGLDTPVQWVFDRTSLRAPPVSLLVVSLSAAEDGPAYADRNADRHLPGRAGRTCSRPPGGARVLDAFVTREPRATFRQGPGNPEAVPRPPARTRLPGLRVGGRVDRHRVGRTRWRAQCAAASAPRAPHSRALGRPHEHPLKEAA